MARIFADRVKESTTTASTSDTITLSGADLGCRTFASTMAIGDTCFFCEDGGITGQWETGIATLTAAATLVKTEVLASSFSNVRVDFSPGPKSIFMAQTTKAFDEISIKQMHVSLSAGQAVHIDAVAILNVYEAYGTGAVGLIPVMTSATTPSGVVTASDTAESGFNLWAAFDGNVGIPYIPNSNTAAGWMQYAFPAQVLTDRWALYVNTATTYNSIPLTFDFKASNDGVNFTTLTSHAYASRDVVPAGWTTYYFNAPVSYRYYRMQVYTTWSNYYNGVLAEIQVFAPATVRLIQPAVDYTVTRATLDYGTQTQIVSRTKAGTAVDHIIEYI
jgi:hypothetical protein